MKPWKYTQVLVSVGVFIPVVRLCFYVAKLWNKRCKYQVALVGAECTGRCKNRVEVNSAHSLGVIKQQMGVIHFMLVTFVISCWHIALFPFVCSTLHTLFAFLSTVPGFSSIASYWMFSSDRHQTLVRACGQTWRMADRLSDLNPQKYLGVFCGGGSVISHGDFLAFVFHVTRSLIFHVIKHLIAMMFLSLFFVIMFCFVFKSLPLVLCDQMRCRQNNQQLNNGGHFFA